MAIYTTEVRTICEYYAGLTNSVGFNDIEETISKAIDNGVIPPYNCFDDNYAKILSTKILYHYYTREIGFETVGLWRLKLQTKLNEIMKYYNQLYESELLKFEPLNDIDITTNRETTGNEDKNRDNLSLRNDVRSNLTENSGDEIQTGSKNKNDISLENESYNKVNSSSENSSENGFTMGNENSNKTIDNTKTIEGTETEETSGNSTTDDTEKSNSISDKTTNRTNSNTQQYSDTPQGGLSDVIHGDYLTNATYNDGNEAGGEVAFDSDEKEKNTTVENSENTTKDINNTETDKGNENLSKSTGNIENRDSEKNVEQNENQSNSKNGTLISDESTNNSLNTNFKENSTTNYTTNSATNSNEQINSTEKYVETVIGHSGKTTFSKSLIEFRETFLNIDMMVIEELQDLFLKLW